MVFVTRQNGENLGSVELGVGRAGEGFDSPVVLVAIAQKSRVKKGKK